MATTITPADLTVTIQEQWTAGGSDRGSTSTLTISNVVNYTNKIVEVGTSAVDILEFGAANSAGTYSRTDVKYIRITNLDDTNYITVGMRDDSGDEFLVKVEAGHSFMVCNDELEANTSGAGFSAFSEADAITCQANGAACDVEIAVALT